MPSLTDTLKPEQCASGFASNWHGTWSVRWFWAGIAGLVGLTALMFCDVLGSRNTILSAGDMDLAKQFIYWRQFAANELRHGNLPLWNPYMFGGAPYLGWAQTAPLYPLNWLDLVLPLAASVNLGVAIHILLAGWFTFAWAMRRGFHPVAAFVSGASYMLCGTYFLHLYAGHLTLLAAFAWAPLVFLCCDGILWTGRLGWVWLGVFAVAMQVFAGDPQCAFYTAVAAGLYSLAQLRGQFKPLRKMALLLGIYFGAAALGAVSLLTTWQAATESTRSSGLDFERSASFFFAIENFITLFVPGFFGDLVGFPYWGRWCLWESIFFVGIGILALAILALSTVRSKFRTPLALVTVALVVLALGAQTPVYGWLYRWLPGMDRFRVPARFLVPASMCLALLAGLGLDNMLRRHLPPRWFVFGFVVIAAVAMGAAIILHQQVRQQIPGNSWSKLVSPLALDGHTALAPPTYRNQDFLEKAGRNAMEQLAICSVVLFGFAALFYFARVRPWVVYLLAGLVVVELFTYARYWRATFDLRQTRSAELEQFLAKHPGDDRLLAWKANLGMAANREEIWGRSPLALKRYLEFIVFSQIQSLDLTTLTRLEFNTLPSMFSLLRCRYFFLSDSNGLHYVEQTNVLARVQLVRDYSVMTNASAILRALADDAFDGRQRVILETPPVPAPDPAAQSGQVRVVDFATDQLTIEADLPAAAILLVTDVYSRGWQVRSLLPEAPQQYTILPADYVLRAVPLAPGHHLLRMEYRPRAFVIGLWITIIALATYLIVLVIWMIQRRRTRI